MEKIERVRLISGKALYLRLIYVVGMIFITWYCVRNNLYSKYGYTILSMTLTANLIWVIGDIRNTAIRTIVDIIKNE
jgi:hypothetical protein